MMLASRNAMCVFVHTSVWLIIICVGLLDATSPNELRHAAKARLNWNKPYVYNSRTTNPTLQDDEQFPMVPENNSDKTTNEKDKLKQKLQNGSRNLKLLPDRDEKRDVNESLAKKDLHNISGQINDRGKPATFQYRLQDMKNGTLEFADQQTSYTSQIIRRQIFNDDRQAGSDEVKRPFHGSSEERSGNKSLKKKEQFNGFPADFTAGLQPFKFQENLRGQNNEPNLGFVNFPEPGNFASLASSLGGLEPFPPLTTSSTTDIKENDKNSDEKKASTISNFGQDTRDFATEPLDSIPPVSRPNHFSSNTDEKPNNLNSFEKQIRRPSLSNEADSKERSPPISFQGSPFFGNIHELDESFPSETPRNLGTGSRFLEGEPVKKNPPENFRESGGGGRQNLNSPYPVAFGSFKDGHGSSSEDHARTRFPHTPPTSQEFPTRHSNENDQQFSSPSSSTLPTPSNFHNADHLPQSEPQNFVPVAHFPNGHFPYPQFDSFRPVHSPDGPPQQSPPVRNFRQISAPQFFITSGGEDFDGNGFFGQAGGPGNFGRGLAPVDSNFDGPHGFSHPQFHFRQQQPHHNHHHHQNSPNIRQNHHSNFHGDDTTNHHSSATNILGSGNFGIIRGGIFADDENPPHTFRPFRGGHGGDDFFHGFRDFQPFGGPLHNALSVKSQNIQNAGSKTQTVTTQIETSTPKNSSMIMDNIQSQSQNHKLTVTVPTTTVKSSN